MSIVFANEEDISKIYDYLNTISTQTQYLTFDSDGLKVSLDAFSKVLLSQLSNPNIKYFCYKVNGNIVGIANYRVDSRTKMSHRAKIGISVLADYQNKGMGKQLLAAMIEYLEQQKQIELVELEVALPLIHISKPTKRRGIWIPVFCLKKKKLGTHVSHDAVHKHQKLYYHL
ncbi:GNAT family N-acetyltransferase, partial [Enterococcus cecorum]|uniref:GNAT family N-acetyltransferase n=1 Tax=Enterococcus cecorum TaxID=44008 RepID=UPI001FAB63E5